MTETDYAGGNLDICRIQKDVANQTFRLYLGRRHQDGYSTALPVTLEERDVGGLMNLAAAVTPEAAQRLFDDLWEDGLRPSSQQRRDVSDELAWLRTQLGLIIKKEWG